MCSLNLPTRKAEPVHKRDTVAWIKCTPNDIEQYQYSVASNLKCILSNTNCKCDPDFVNEILRHAEKYLHVPTSKLNHIAKAYWAKEDKEKHTQAIRLWIQEGRPRGHDSFSFIGYKRAKGRFQNIQRWKIYEHENRNIDDLNQVDEIDYKLLWKLLRKCKGVTPSIAATNFAKMTSHNYTNDHVVKGFKNHFKKVFNDNDCSIKTIQRLSKIKELNQLIKATYDNDLKGLTNGSTTDEIQWVIKTLNKLKNPGCNNILNENLIHGREAAIEGLCVLFNSVLHQERTPSLWANNVLVPFQYSRERARANQTGVVNVQSLWCHVKVKCLRKSFWKYVKEGCCQLSTIWRTSMTL